MHIKSHRSGWTVSAVLGRLVLGVMAAGAAWLLVRGPRPDSDVPDDRVVVTYWEKWTGTEAAQLRSIVDEFNRTVGKEKGIYVQLTTISSIHHKTLVATAAGVPPDIAGVWYGQVPQYAALGAVTDLTDLAAAGGITEDYYKPVYWDGCLYRGRLYGLISTPWAVALHYDKQALIETGLDPDRPPRTLEELARYTEAINRYDEDGFLTRAGYVPTLPNWFLPMLPIWFGGQVYDEQTDELTLTSPEVLAAFQWLYDYNASIGPRAIRRFQASMGSRTWASPQNPFLSGDQAMLQQGVWLANFIETQKPSWNRWRLDGVDVEQWKRTETRLPLAQRRAHYRWGAAPFPSSVEGPPVTFAGFDVLVIPSTAKHKKEAMEFLLYLNRQEVMEKLCSMHCKNSPLAEVSEEFLANHPNPYIHIFEQMTAGPGAHTYPKIPIWTELEMYLLYVAQEIGELRAEPAEILAETQRIFTAKYDRFRARQRMRDAR
ncbi:MAG: extracellular solute-binding protein [Phycisphaerae bacterium]